MSLSVSDSVRYEVIGVLEDFHDNGLWDPVDPCVFRLTTLDKYYYLTARVRGDELVATNAFLAETWARIAPDDPYEGHYQDDVMAEAMLIFVIALVTVGGRVYTIATANPVNALRYE